MQRHRNIFATIFLFGIFIQTQYTSAQNDSNDFYTAAVVEFAPEYDDKMSATNIIEKNLEKYLDYIKQAQAKKADIIVFPEYGLTSVHFPNNTNDAIKYTSVIPDPKEKIVPCNTGNREEWSASLKRLSCEAQNSKIYVVVNLPERFPIKNKQDEFLLYNTNIVFDRNGTLIARYRKYNLFSEPIFNRTKTPELVTFDTDFGVTFGTFICFDILFAEPAMTLIKEKKVTDFVFSTAWFSELPFLSGLLLDMVFSLSLTMPSPILKYITTLQVQSGWARANKVNLLAAGYDDPMNFSGGSGIYSNGIRDYLVPVAKSSHLLVTKVMKTKSDSFNDTIIPAPRTANYLHTIQENMTTYTTEELKSDISEKKVCHGEFCCKFSASFKQQEKIYRMVVFRGERIFGVEKHTVEICGIVVCANNTVESCGSQINQYVGQSDFTKLEVTGEFNKEDSYIHFPSIVSYDLAPVGYSKYSYKTEIWRCVKSIELKANEQLTNIVGFGIYGIKRNSASSNVPLLLLVCVTTFVLMWNKNNV